MSKQKLKIYNNNGNCFLSGELTIAERVHKIYIPLQYYWSNFNIPKDTNIPLLRVKEIQQRINSYFSLRGC